MDQILKEMERIGIISYLDNMIIASKTREQHIRDVTRLREIFSAAKLHSPCEKCLFFHTEFGFLAFKITQKGMECSVEHKNELIAYKKPESKKETLQFFRFCHFLT
jgi:hypothetical protein